MFFSLSPSAVCGHPVTDSECWELTKLKIFQSPPTFLKDSYLNNIILVGIVLVGTEEAFPNNNMLGIFGDFGCDPFFDRSLDRTIWVSTSLVQ